MEFFGILRFAQDDSKGKSRFLSGMTDEKQEQRQWQNMLGFVPGGLYSIGEGYVNGVAFDDAVTGRRRLGDHGTDGGGLRGGRD